MPLDPVVDDVIGNTAILRRFTRLGVAPRLLAQRLQETKASVVSALPPACERDSNHVDFACLDDGRVVCATTQGAYVLRSSSSRHQNSRHNSTRSRGRSETQGQWEFVRCPINHYGLRCLHPLRLSSGFAVGLGSGDYYLIGTDGRAISSTVKLNRRPKRRYGESGIAALGRQWNRATPTKNLVELHNWREGPPLNVGDWDFYETGSSLLAMHAGFDYIGLHDRRIDCTGKDKVGKQQICVYRGKDVDRRESFTRCCFLGEHIVATTSSSLAHPVRLWDLRNTRASSGSILSFPLDESAADLRAWPLSNETNALQTKGDFGLSKRPYISQLQRIDDRGYMLLTGLQSDEAGSGSGTITSNLLVDPVRESIRCVSSHKRQPNTLLSSCVVSFPSSSFSPVESLLACPVQSNMIDLVDIHSTAARSGAPANKRRRTNWSSPVSKTGRVVGKFEPEILDKYGLPSHLVRLTWDAKGSRLVGLSEDFDIFTWQV